MSFLLKYGDEGPGSRFVSKSLSQILEFHYRTDSPSLSLKLSLVVCVCIGRVTAAEVRVRVQSSLENREILMTWLVELICRTSRILYRISCVRCSVENVVTMILKLCKTV